MARISRAQSLQLDGRRRLGDLLEVFLDLVVGDAEQPGCEGSVLPE